jgi:putative membrane protein
MRSQPIALRRLLTLLLVASWCALFWTLLLTGRTAMFLSPRTDWVVPVGAVILTAASVGLLISIRSDNKTAKPLQVGELGGYALLSIPVVVILALPDASLGSYAAGRRSNIVGGSFVSTAADINDGELTLVDVGGALRSPEAMRALSAQAGSKVTFVGFVTRSEEDGADEFTLTRFMISCCLADALSVEVRVVGAPPGRFEEDDWVRVTGEMYPLETEVVIDASEVLAVQRPKQPYLSP